MGNITIEVGGEFSVDIVAGKVVGISLASKAAPCRRIREYVIAIITLILGVIEIAIKVLEDIGARVRPAPFTGIAIVEVGGSCRVIGIGIRIELPVSYDKVVLFHLILHPCPFTLWIIIPCVCKRYRSNVKRGLSLPRSIPLKMQPVRRSIPPRTVLWLILGHLPT